MNLKLRKNVFTVQMTKPSHTYGVSMKPSVLCITRNALSEQSIPSSNAQGIYPFNLNQVAENQFHFINRDIVDDSYPDNHAVGCLLPQILGYCVIRCGEYVLTYSRKKGAESRLHGSRSIGFGGHVDIEDYNKSFNAPYFVALATSIERELFEEIGLVHRVGYRNFDSIIVDQTNPVGKVHVGLPLHIQLQTRNELEIDHSEISDPVWTTVAELKDTIDQFENWSKLLIEKL